MRRADRLFQLVQLMRSRDVVTARLAEVRAADGVTARLTPETLAMVDEAIALAGPELADAGVPVRGAGGRSVRAAAPLRPDRRQGLP